MTTRQEKELNAAYDDAYGEFKKSEQYKNCPQQKKEAKEKEKKWHK